MVTVSIERVPQKDVTNVVFNQILTFLKNCVDSNFRGIIFITGIVGHLRASILIDVVKGSADDDDGHGYEEEVISIISIVALKELRIIEGLIESSRVDDFQGKTVPLVR